MKDWDRLPSSVRLTISGWNERENFNLDSLSTHQAGQVRRQKQGKEHGRTQGAASRRRTTGLGNSASQARTPSRVRRGASAGTGIWRARASDQELDILVIAS